MDCVSEFAAVMEDAGMVSVDHGNQEGGLCRLETPVHDIEAY